MDNVSTIILAGALVIIILGMGMSLELKDFKRIILYPKTIFVGLMNQLILLPHSWFRYYTFVSNGASDCYWGYDFGGLPWRTNLI